LVTKLMGMAEGAAAVANGECMLVSGFDKNGSGTQRITPAGPRCDH
jgi:hypothetical protein